MSVKLLPTKQNRLLFPRRSWMPCRTRLRPAAPSSVSSGLDSIQPSWWPTTSTSTARRQSPTHQDTSGLQTGESTRRWLRKQRKTEILFQRVTQCCCPSPTYSSGVFEIAEANGVQQGTKIVLHLKDDCKEFSSEDRVKGAEQHQPAQRPPGPKTASTFTVSCVLQRSSQSTATLSVSPSF